MVRTINDYVSIKVVIMADKKSPTRNLGYVTLYDHNTGRTIRTIRGRYIIPGTTEEQLEHKVRKELTPVITRYSILANVLEQAEGIMQTDILEWLDTDSQFNDALWHGKLK